MIINQVNNTPYSILMIDRNKNKFKILEKDSVFFVPDSKNIVENFVEDLNSQKLHCCARYSSYSFLLLIIYIVSFMILALTGNLRYFYLPLIAFLLFFIIIITSSCYQYRYQKKIRTIVFSYESKLSGKYQIQSHYNQPVIYSRSRHYYRVYQIKLIPNFGYQQFIVGNPNFMVNPAFGQVYIQQTGQQNQKDQMNNFNQNYQYQYNNQQNPQNLQNLQNYNPQIYTQNNQYQQAQQDLPIYQVNMQDLEDNRENAKNKQIQKYCKIILKK